MKKIYLITGATGHTGGSTLDILLSKGHSVRAFVRKRDERSEALERRGVEIAVGDLSDFQSVRAALDGIFGAYFVYPIHPGLIEATSFFALAAKEAGVKIVVNMSQISARREAKSHAAFDHWLAERVFDWSGLPVTHVRPTFFTDWLTYPNIAAAIKSGTVELGFKDGKHAPIASEDQGRFITAVLESPERHIGKTYPLYGPKEYTHAELFATVGKILGREIRYQSATDAEVEKAFSEMRSPFLGQHIIEVSKDHTAGVFSGTDQIIEQVTGVKPMGVEEYVAKHRSAFNI